MQPTRLHQWIFSLERMGVRGATCVLVALLPLVPLAAVPSPAEASYRLSWATATSEAAGRAASQNPDAIEIHCARASERGFTCVVTGTRSQHRCSRPLNVWARRARADRHRLVIVSRWAGSPVCEAPDVAKPAPDDGLGSRTPITPATAEFARD